MLVERMTGMKLGVDIARPMTRPSSSLFPGRLSVNACVGFGLAALVLWQLLLPPTPSRRKLLAVLAAVVGAIGVAGCIGHAVKLEYLFSVARANRLALPTAYCLVALAIALGALLAHQAPQARPTVGDLRGHGRRIVFRSLALLASVLLAAFVGGFSLFQHSFEKSQGEDLLQTATTNAEAMVHAMETAAWFSRMVATRPTVTSGMQRLQRSPGDSDARARLNAVAASFLSGGVSHVRLLDERGKVLADAGLARL